MKRAVVLFTRDLRVHDHAALTAAVEIASAYVPELSELEGPTIHEPWRAPLAARAPEYPERIVDLDRRAARA